jgi:hypothetical protein
VPQMPEAAGKVDDLPVPRTTLRVPAPSGEQVTGHTGTLAGQRLGLKLVLMV